MFTIAGSQQQSQMPGGSHCRIIIVALLFIATLCMAVVYFLQSPADQATYDYRYVAAMR